jgi:hypothetical protein
MTMTRATTFAGASLAAFLLLHPWPSRADEPVPRIVGRGDLEAFEAQLDRAVAEVSRPAPGIVLGRSEAARGYHLRGYGAVFVLSPRALPRPGDVLVVRRRVLPGGSARIEIESHSEGTGNPSEDARLLAEHARQALRASKGGVRSPGGDGEEEIAALEREVLEFQQEAELARQMAERDFDRLTQDMRGRFAPPVPTWSAGPINAAAPPEPPPAPGAPGPPPAPPVAAPPAAPVAAAPASGPTAVAPPRAPTAPIGPASPNAPVVIPEAPQAPPPPWRFWFRAESPSDDRTPERVLGDVRSAVVATLESQGPRLRGLGAEECVAVAIDFVPTGVFMSQARPVHTLVIRARKQDLDARQAGRLSADEFRQRLEVNEY